MAELDLSKKVADRYLKREKLGEGTYGVVFKAIDTKVSSERFLLEIFLCPGFCGSPCLLLFLVV